MVAEKKGSLADLLKNANKKYNVSAGKISEISEDVTFLSTGNIAIDHIMGGGIPMGRSTELFGPTSCGKTTTALQTCVWLQRIIKAGGDPKLGIGPDDKILYLDFEQAMDPVYVAKLGLDLDHESFIFAQPGILEEGANFARAAIETGEIRLVVWDSVASMQPSAKAEAEIGKSLPAVTAKLMADLTQSLNPILKDNNCASIWLNHIAEVMEMGGARRPGMPARTTTPGGRALKYYASTRVEYKQIGNIKTEIIDDLTNEIKDVPTATNTLVKVVKNKVAPPFKEAIVRVRFGIGFDNYWTALQILLAHKKITKETGGRYYFHKLEEFGLAPDWMPRAASGTKRPTIHGDKNLVLAGDEHADWKQAIIDRAVIVLRDEKIPEGTDLESGEVTDDIEELLGA